jgi:hypothetical protein
MTTTDTTTATAVATSPTHMQKVGRIVELAATAAFAVGIILSSHHHVIGAFFVGSVAAFAVGWKMRKS